MTDNLPPVRPVPDVLLGVPTAPSLDQHRAIAPEATYAALTSLERDLRNLMTDVSTSATMTGEDWTYVADRIASAWAEVQLARRTVSDLVR